MFWRKQRRAIEGFHPLHRQLVFDRTFSATMNPAGWAAFVASLAAHERIVRRDKWALPERVPRVVVPLLRALSADTPAGGALSLSVDLRGPRAPGKTSLPRPVRLPRPVISATEQVTVDRWLRAHAVLRDGGEVALEVVDRTRTRDVKKRSRSGRVKIRQKIKQAQRISAQRRLPKGVACVRPHMPPPREINTRVGTRKRTVIRAVGKYGFVPAPQPQLDYLLWVLAEPFRWTPPRTGRAR